MNLLKKTSFLFIVIAIMLSGIFCYKGFQQMNSHCMDDSTYLCSDFIVHGTIINDALLGTIFFILLLSFIIISKSFRNNILFYFNKIYFNYYQTYRLNKIPIIPIMLAFYSGIIHPRIP